jgi:hypothetical protein
MLLCASTAVATEISPPLRIALRKSLISAELFLVVAVHNGNREMIGFIILPPSSY